MRNCVIITGSSGAIGEALSAKYAFSGYRVIGVDIHLSSKDQEGDFVFLHQDLNEIVVNSESRTLFFQKLIELLPKHLERLILINNAAVQIVKPISELVADDLTSSFSINVVAPFLLIQGLKDLLQKYRGQVINISSIHAKLTKKNFLSYSVTKTALDGLTRACALELSHLVTINSVSPAAIDTEMLRKGFDSDDSLRKLKEFHPAGRIGNSKDLATLIKGITDQNNSFLSGSIIDYSGAINGVLHDPY